MIFHNTALQYAETFESGMARSSRDAYCDLRSTRGSGAGTEGLDLRRPFRLFPGGLFVRGEVLAVLL